MKFEFMEKHQGSCSVEKMAAVLEVSRSGYCAWLSSPRSVHNRMAEVLVEAISAIQKRLRFRDGAKPMVQAPKRLRYGANHKRVARFIKQNGLQVRSQRTL